jgi:hypothetical protein
MPRPFVFPDPNDRSPNSPSDIVNSTQVLGIYKQYSGEKMERVTKKVQDWFCNEAMKKYKWDNATFSGNQCVLSVNIEKRTIPDE